MIYKNIKLVFISIFIYFALVLLTICFDFYINTTIDGYLFNDPFSNIGILIFYILFILPIIEIVLCKIIVKYLDDTILIKILSTWWVPIFCLFSFLILDLLLLAFPLDLNFLYYCSLPLDLFVAIASFSASFLPIFLTGIWYKIEKKRNISNLFKLKYNLYAYPLIIIAYWVLKFVGILIIFSFETKFNYFGIF